MTKRELNSAYPDPSFSSNSSAAYSTDRDRNLVYASSASSNNNNNNNNFSTSTNTSSTDKMGESFNNILPTHKKMKLDGHGSTSPNSGGDSNGSNLNSRVVHIRGVPPETTVNDLLLLSHSFGTVTNTLLMKSKGQAFVEFQTPYQAQTMTQHWEQTTVNGVPNQVQITLRGRNVKCQLSAHKELKTRIENNNETEKSLMEFQNSLDKDTSSKPSPVIRVVIENMHYAVTLEMLHSVFSRAGQVQKVVTFMKNGAFQALVQYAEISDAIKAKQTLNGQHLFLNANVFRIEYSKTQNLVVKYNNEKSCDYTKSLPNGEHGNGGGGDGFHFSADHISDPLRSFQFGRQNLYGGNNSFTALGFSPVLFVSGLSEQITPDALFTLFGVYGDVMRVKIMFNKKETALIQLAEGTQAQMAIANLDRIKLYGNTLRVNSSKHQTVQMPKDGFQDSGLTKDFTNSPLHRFKRPGSKNYHNIYAPSETLHVSNIPPSCTEENIRDAFIEQSGMEPTKFRFFPNDNKMALVQFNSVESSIIALTKMHNYKVADHSHLRVSFSKSSV